MPPPLFFESLFASSQSGEGEGESGTPAAAADIGESEQKGQQGPQQQPTSDTLSGSLALRTHTRVYNLNSGQNYGNNKQPQPLPLPLPNLRSVKSTNDLLDSATKGSSMEKLIGQLTIHPTHYPTHLGDGGDGLAKAAAGRMVVMATNTTAVFDHKKYKHQEEQEQGQEQGQGQGLVGVPRTRSASNWLCGMFNKPTGPSAPMTPTAPVV